MMIAALPLSRRIPSPSCPSRSEAPSPSSREIRRLLRRLGRHESLLRTIAAAPRSEAGRRVDPEC